MGGGVILLVGSSFPLRPTVASPSSELEALIEACVADDGRGAAVRALRSRLRQIAGPGESAATLLRAAEHLLAGVLSRSTPNVAMAWRLLREAAAELQAQQRDGAPAPGAALGDRVLDLVERIDLLASGVDDLPLHSPQPALPRAEPPVLTEREDGSRVELGRFDEPAGADTPTATGSASARLPSTVEGIVDALDAAIVRAQGELETLLAVANRRPSEDVQRALRQLAETVGELEDLKDALARWTFESAALLRDTGR